MKRQDNVNCSGLHLDLYLTQVKISDIYNNIWFYSPFASAKLPHGNILVQKLYYL